MGPQAPIICIMATGFALVAGNVYAATLSDGSASYRAFAEVVGAEKITRLEKQRTPVERCTWVQLPSRVRYEHPYGERRVIERQAERCRTTYETRTIKHVTGYNVTLRYNGETFSRRMLTHPGVRFPVTVDIVPIELP